MLISCINRGSISHYYSIQTKYSKPKTQISTLLFPHYNFLHGIRAVRFSWTKKLYRYFIIDHNRPKLIKEQKNQNKKKPDQTKPNQKQNQTRTIISMAQMEQHLLQLIQKYNKKIHTRPEISIHLNFKNYTK